MNRRDFLTATGGMLLIPGFAAPLLAQPAAEKFRFVHFTDLHIQPELGAAEGVALAVKKLLSLRPRPDFVITGGDHVMDLLKVERDRAEVQFRLLAEALKPLEMPIYSAVGNHDVYGWSQKSDTLARTPEYGKALFAERVAKGKTYRSFDHRGWHFVILDSIEHVPPYDWRGGVDDAQLQWLKSDLERIGKQKPIVLISHVPLMTLFAQYTSAATAATPDTLIVRNGKEIRDLFSPYNVKAVLQGHTHVVEDCLYTGTHYITSGAVCGDWWKGARLGVHPEGFAVCDVDGDRLQWQYVTYGWKARSA
jgi:3',5'-cyclic AMP phosphodiesterase CpdA